MNGLCYYLGYRKGWKLAVAYATGTRGERSAIRRRLAILNDSYSGFARGLWAGFGDLADQRSQAIRSGRARRTVNPFKLARVLERIASYHPDLARRGPSPSHHVTSHHRLSRSWILKSITRKLRDGASVDAGALGKSAA
jgi:hypothetical protein